MIITTIKTVFSRLPFRWYESLFVVVLFIGGGVLWYQSSKIDTLAEEIIIADEAVASALLVNDVLTKQQRIDQSVVLDWMSAREAYRDAQRSTIDTTFLTYFNTPIEESPTDEPTPPPTVNTPQSSVTSPPPAMSDRQLDALTDGMWDVYCQTGADDPDCLP